MGEGGEREAHQLERRRRREPADLGAQCPDSGQRRRVGGERRHYRRARVDEGQPPVAADGAERPRDSRMARARGTEVDDHGGPRLEDEPVKGDPQAGADGEPAEAAHFPRVDDGVRQGAAPEPYGEDARLATGRAGFKHRVGRMGWWLKVGAGGVGRRR